MAFLVLIFIFIFPGSDNNKKNLFPHLLISQIVSFASLSFDRRGLIQGKKVSKFLSLRLKLIIIIIVYGNRNILLSFLFISFHHQANQSLQTTLMRQPNTKWKTRMRGEIITPRTHQSNSFIDSEEESLERNTSGHDRPGCTSRGGRSPAKMRKE